MLYIFWFLHQTTTGSVNTCVAVRLYIFWFLHQTTTMVLLLLVAIRLYIFWFLHQTTTLHARTDAAHALYIFWFLHQTTTYGGRYSKVTRCISFDSYIKPQLNFDIDKNLVVVYLLIPTSNHNYDIYAMAEKLLYIFWFLHRTTTYRFEQTDYQRITNTLSNKKWRVGYKF